MEYLRSAMHRRSRLCGGLTVGLDASRFGQADARVRADLRARPRPGAITAEIIDHRDSAHHRDRAPGDRAPYLERTGRCASLAPVAARGDPVSCSNIFPVGSARRCGECAPARTNSRTFSSPTESKRSEENT